MSQSEETVVGEIALWRLRLSAEFCIPVAEGDDLRFRIEVLEPGGSQADLARYRLRVWREEMFQLEVFMRGRSRLKADHTVLVADDLFDGMMFAADTPEAALSHAIARIGEQCGLE